MLYLFRRKSLRISHRICDSCDTIINQYREHISDFPGYCTGLESELEYFQQENVGHYSFTYILGTGLCRNTEMFTDA